MACLSIQNKFTLNFSHFTAEIPPNIPGYFNSENAKKFGHHATRLERNKLWYYFCDVAVCSAPLRTSSGMKISCFMHATVLEAINVELETLHLGGKSPITKSTSSKRQVIGKQRFGMTKNFSIIACRNQLLEFDYCLLELIWSC